LPGPILTLWVAEPEPWFILERTKKKFDIEEYASSAEELTVATAAMYFSDSAQSSGTGEPCVEKDSNAA
jgi:hypothetical protein